jgi:hypothetical protein
MLVVILSGCQEQVVSNPVSKMKGDTAKETILASQNAIASDAATSFAKKEKDTIVIAYYFHRTIRCPACLAIEANAGRIIKENFPQQIADGSLIWTPINLDDPGGDEFSKKFDVSVSTLVLSKMKDGNLIEYKKLEKVWQLLGDTEGFSQYITEEIIEYLQ